MRHSAHARLRHVCDLSPVASDSVRRPCRGKASVGKKVGTSFNLLHVQIEQAVRNDITDRRVSSDRIVISDNRGHAARCNGRRKGASREGEWRHDARTTAGEAAHVYVPGVVLPWSWWLWNETTVGVRGRGCCGACFTLLGYAVVRGSTRAPGQAQEGTRPQSLRYSAASCSCTDDRT